MKGIYLTEEGLQAIEDKIAELDRTEDPNSECACISQDYMIFIINIKGIIIFYTFIFTMRPISIKTMSK